MITSTLVALLAAEVVVRVSGQAPEVRPIGVTHSATVYRRSANPMLGFELKANHRDESADSRSSYRYTNAHGQRDIERTLEKSPGSTRVILLGDSVVEGHGIPEIDDTISRQLERLDPNGTTEVLNFGVSAYCTRAEVELLEVKGLQFEPDVVIVLFVENDFDNFNAETWELESGSERPAAVRHLFHGSALFRLLCVRFNWFGFGVEADPVGWNTRAIGDNNVVVGLQRLRELADTHGFQPIIAIWPRFEDDEIADVHFMPGSEDELVIERLAQMNGLPTVRLSEYFERHRDSAEVRPNPRLAYSDGDGMHPSVAGSRVAAWFLQEILEADPTTLVRADRRAPRSEDLEAIEAAKSRSTTDPGYSLVANTRGNELLAEGRTGEAIDSFRRALEDDPDFAEAHVNLGVALAAQGRRQEAVESYRRALEIRPDLASAHTNLGNELAIQDRIPEAIEHYRAALRIDPDYGPAHLNLGRALGAAGNADEAIEHFRTALEVDPNNVSAYNNLGGLLTTQGKLAEAADEYRKALALRPDYVLAHYNLGTVMAELGRQAEALVHFREADRLRPDWPPALTRIAWILATQPGLGARDREEALRRATRAAELKEGDDAAVLDALAASQAAAGEFDAAVETAEAALAVARNDEQAAAIRARLVLYQQNRPYSEPEKDF